MSIGSYDSVLDGRIKVQINISYSLLEELRRTDDQALRQMRKIAGKIAESLLWPISALPSKNDIEYTIAISPSINAITKKVEHKQCQKFVGHRRF